MNELARLTPKKRKAIDPIKGTNLCMEDYWSWAHSNLLEMTTRSAFSEFLVASALGATEHPREVWSPHDVITPDNIRIEVKAAGHIQDYGQKKLSLISFGIAANRSWDAVANTLHPTGERSSDVYVFAVLSHTHKPSVDPSNTDQWTFYVLPTSALHEIPKQKTIKLSSLMRFNPIQTKYSGLKDAVLKAYEEGQQAPAPYSSPAAGSESGEA